MLDEELIKYAWPQDVWFHVDKLSSAHVYLRLPASIPSWDQIPQALLSDCAQLVKANSIEGNKKDDLTIIYTPADNLKVRYATSPCAIILNNAIHIVENWRNGYRTSFLPQR